MASAFAFVFLVSGLIFVVQLLRRKWKNSAIWFAVVVACVIGVGVTAPATTNSSSSSTSNSQPQETSDTQTDAPPDPTATPESTAEQKRDFLAEVDESISGARIEGAPFKFVGKKVDLHCTVGSIPQEDFFNAACGTDEDGSPVTIVIQANSRQLETNQAVRILGTVVEPMDGQNAMGGETHFPTVQANFME